MKSSGDLRPEHRRTARLLDMRIRGIDAALWSVEKHPMLRPNLAAAVSFDRSFDHDRLVDKAERATGLLPQLRRVAVDTLSMAPRWQVDPNFDVGSHLRFIGAPGDGTSAAVLRFLETFVMDPFDASRPPWEIVVVEGMAAGQTAVVLKMSHVIADGVGWLLLLMQLFDLEESPEDGPPPKSSSAQGTGRGGRTADVPEHSRPRVTDVAARAARALMRSPVETMGRGVAMARSSARVFKPWGRRLSPVMTERSTSVRLDNVVVPMAEARAAAKAAGAGINDFFVAGVLDGLRRYHDLHGATHVALRVGLPINVRGRDDSELGGNHFVVCRFVAPLQSNDPAERMRFVRSRVAELRAEPALTLAETFAEAGSLLPRAALVGLLRLEARSIDVIVSNCGRVPIPVYLAGAKMVAPYLFGPRCGAAANFVLLGYLDHLYVGINSDPAAIPDGDTFIACLEDAFRHLLRPIS